MISLVIISVLKHLHLICIIIITLLIINRQRKKHQRQANMAPAVRLGPIPASSSSPSSFRNPFYGYNRNRGRNLNSSNQNRNNENDNDNDNDNNDGDGENDKGPYVQKYLNNCKSFYSCIHCRTHLTNHDELVSRSFHGNSGRAYLFDSVINISLGPAVQRDLITGSHSVADIYCKNCGTTMGWKYEKAYVETQKYKEGKYIIELVHVVRENRYLELDNSTYPYFSPSSLKDYGTSNSLYLDSTPYDWKYLADSASSPASPASPPSPILSSAAADQLRVDCNDDVESSWLCYPDSVQSTSSSSSSSSTSSSSSSSPGEPSASREFRVIKEQDY